MRRYRELIVGTWWAEDSGPNGSWVLSFCDSDGHWDTYTAYPTFETAAAAVGNGQTGQPWWDHLRAHTSANFHPDLWGRAE